MDSATTIEQKTLAYWNTSSTFRGKPSQTPDMNMQQGLKSCSDNLAVLGPQRPLAKRTSQLLEQLIEGKPRRKSKQNTATVLRPEFRRAAGI